MTKKLTSLVILLFAILVFLHLFHFSSVVRGQTVTGLTITPPNPVSRSPITVIVNGSGTIGAGCTLNVNFGDGTIRSITGRSLPLTVFHSYTRVGFFVLEATLAGACPISGAVQDVDVRTPTTVPLSLTRVEMRFENSRGEVTVPRDFRDLKAYADILFDGSGLLTAAWEVDGRTLAIVHEYLTFGSRKVFVSPEIPRLPTFEPGLHTLTFRVISPAPSFTIPSINYYVEAKPAGPEKIELTSPSDKAKLPEPQASFRWKAVAGAASYRVEIFAEGKKEPVFRALTRESNYVMPELYHRLFVSGSSYRWQTKGLDEKGAEIAESEARGFVWQP